MILCLLFGICILLCVSIAILVILFALFIFQSDIKGAPFVDNKSEVIQLAIEQLNLTEADTFCDLGSGSGQVLEYVCKHYPYTKVMGVEAAIIPYFISKIRLRKYLGKNLEIYRTDIREFDFKLCNKIYFYLFPKLLSEISEKLSGYIESGKIKCVSCVFAIPDLPVKNEVKIFHPLFKKRVSLFIY